MDATDIPFPDTPDEFVHALPDEAPRISAGIDHFGVGAVLEATARAVESSDRDRASLALAFLRDGILLARHRGLDTEYRRSGLLELLRLKLYAPEYAIRGSAIYTLGKLGPRENARHLRAALPWYVDHDPLRLDALIFELGWLAGRRRIDHRQLLTDLATSRAYLTRWATVQILWERQMSSGRLEWGARRSPGWAIQLLRRLAQDSHPAVRHDARGALAERRRRKLEGRWSTPEGRQAILGPEPGDFALRIESLAIQVGNYLYCSGEPDYDVDLVEAVARHTDLHPVSPGYDPEVYWAPLAEARPPSRAR